MVVDCFLIMSPAESVVARYSCKDTGGDYRNVAFGIGICSFSVSSPNAQKCTWYGVKDKTL